MTWTDHKVLVTSDFQDLSSTLKQRVDGIVGEDVLREFRSVVIDFQHHNLCAENQSQNTGGSLNELHY